MLKLILKATGNELFDRITVLVNGEEGKVTGSPITNGKQFYQAVFPIYGEEVCWIPSECCDVTEIEDATT